METTASGLRPNEADQTPRELACAPCGPECRFASELPQWPEFIWCSYKGAPWRTDGRGDCPNFSPRRAGAAASADNGTNHQNGRPS